MRKYFIFLLLFNCFFPLLHKIVLSVLLSLQEDSSVILPFVYNKFGLLSFHNLIIANVAAILTFFFSNVMNKWALNKK